MHKVYASCKWKLWAHKGQPEPGKAERTASGRKKPTTQNWTQESLCVCLPAQQSCVCVCVCVPASMTDTQAFVCVLASMTDTQSYVCVPTSIANIQSYQKHTGLGEMYTYVNNGTTGHRDYKNTFLSFNPLECYLVGSEALHPKFWLC